jgi:UDP-glucose 4-epimerase
MLAPLLIASLWIYAAKVLMPYFIPHLSINLTSSLVQIKILLIPTSQVYLRPPLHHDSILGTLNLLEAAIHHNIHRFIFTSTTSVFGKALVPSADHESTTWITESVIPIPKNIYGITKLCAENLCKLYHDLHASKLSCLILRTSRFFPEEDDEPNQLNSFKMSDENLKYNEYLHRRVHIHDVVTAHLQADTAAQHIGYGIYIISSTSPFSPSDAHHLRSSPADIVEKYYPEYREIYEKKDWKMSPLDRVYVNERAREELGWNPQYDYKRMLSSLSITESEENEEKGGV